MLSILILLVFAIPVVAVVMVITAVIKRNSSGNEQSDFEKITRAIYVYLILICLLCAMIGGTIFLFNSAMNYFLPEKEYSDHYLYNNEERNKNEALVGILTSSALLISTVPLFIYHSKIAKNEKGKEIKS